MRPSLLVLLSLALAACPKRSADQIHAEKKSHRFDDAEAWARRFDDPARDEWQKPEEIIAALGLSPDSSLADLGSATGYFAVRFARALPKGTVYGIDVESSMTDYLKKRAERERLDNLVSVLGDYDDPKIPKAVDCILIVNTYHHIEARPEYFRRLASSLKPGGRIAVIDFKKGVKRGPPDSEKLTPEEVAAELLEAGYTQSSSWAFLPDQYFLAFSRK